MGEGLIGFKAGKEMGGVRRVGEKGKGGGGRSGGGGNLVEPLVSLGGSAQKSVGQTPQGVRRGRRGGWVWARGRAAHKVSHRHG